MTDIKIKKRLEYLRTQIEGECISYGEIAELQGLAEHIEKDDVVLLEWAGVPEFPEECNFQGGGVCKNTDLTNTGGGIMLCTEHNFEPEQCEHYECKRLLEADEDLHTHYDDGKEVRVCLECWEKLN